MNTSRTKASLMAGLLAVTVFIAGCSKGGIGTDAKVASVDGTPITKTEYDKTYNEFSRNFGLDRMPVQQREMIADTLKQMTLNKLILQTMIYNEAGKEGIKVTDADVQQYKQEKIYKDPALKEQFKQFLAQQGMSEADFDGMLKDNLLLNKFVEAKGGTQVQVSDAEVNSFYEQHKDQFNVPESIKASHILVKAIVPEMKREVREKNPKLGEADVEKQVTQQRAELKAKADKLFAEVKADPNKFAEVAKANSDDMPSAKNGGELGTPLVEGQTDPEFWKAIEKTAPGQMYPGVVTSQFGFHIVKVLDKKPPHKETFAEAKDIIKEHLGQQRKQEFLQEWAMKERSTAKIVVEPAYQPKAAEPAAGGQGMPMGAAPGGQPTAGQPAPGAQ